MKHIIEEIESGHYILDECINIKYVYRLGDEGWCIFDKTKSDFQQDLIDDFENALLSAMKQPLKNKKVLTPPAGV